MKPKSCITAVVLLCLGWAWVVWAPEPVFLGISLAILLVAIFEYAQALKHHGVEAKMVLLFGGGILGFVGLFLCWQGGQENGLLALAMAFISPLPFVLFSAKKKKSALFWHWLNLIWLVPPFFLLALLRYWPPEGSRLIFWLLLVVAANDSAAYFGGRRFGKTKLAPKISPKKTVEGSAFGVLGGTVMGFLLWPYMMPYAQPMQVAGLAMTAILAGQAGDLFESGFKRICGIKDSGKILPGHGGFLDRFDALFLALPMFVFTLKAFGLEDQW